MKMNKKALKVLKKLNGLNCPEANPEEDGHGCFEEKQTTYYGNLILSICKNT
jgi:hypothetical protein